LRSENTAVLGFYDGLGYQPGAVTSIEKWLDPSKRGDR
jgi:hypothetical protein